MPSWVMAEHPSANFLKVELSWDSAATQWPATTPAISWRKHDSPRFSREPKCVACQHTQRAVGAQTSARANGYPTLTMHCGQPHQAEPVRWGSPDASEI